MDLPAAQPDRSRDWPASSARYRLASVLRLDALGGVDEQHGALAGGQAAGDLVAEVDVAGGVDQV